MFVTISYDIRSNKRRRHLVKLLQKYGVRVQYSVFEHTIPEGKLDEIREKALSIIQNEDSIRYYPLCEKCVKKIISQGSPYKERKEDDGRQYKLF